MVPSPSAAITYEPCADDYDLKWQLGTVCGDKGLVWAAEHRSSKVHVAVKIYNLDICHEEFELIKHEIHAVCQLQHKNIMNYLGSFSVGHELWIVMPFMGYQSAARLVASDFREGLPEMALAFIAKDVLSALSYLHARGVIHRGIRGSHILIDASGRCILTGLRHCVDVVSQGQRQKTIHSYPAQAVFNLNWLSPEILKQDVDGYCERSDMYSVGITLCELGNGEVPWCRLNPELMLVEKLHATEPFLFDSRTCQQIAENIQGLTPGLGVGGSYADYLVNLPKATDRFFTYSAHEFVSLCLTFDPEERPSADQLLHHAFIRQTKKSTQSLTQILYPVAPIMNFWDAGDNDADLLEHHMDKISLGDSVEWDL